MVKSLLPHPRLIDFRRSKLQIIKQWFERIADSGQRLAQSELSRKRERARVARTRPRSFAYVEETGQIEALEANERSRSRATGARGRVQRYCRESEPAVTCAGSLGCGGHVMSWPILRLTKDPSLEGRSSLPLPPTCLSASAPLRQLDASNGRGLVLVGRACLGPQPFLENPQWWNLLS